MLHVEQIDVSYGNFHALKQVSVEVRAGEIVALIGANGAGKSTVLKAVSGLIRPTQGSIRYLGESIEKMSVERIVSKGISHVPEGRRIFPGLTVLGNLEVATSSWRKGGEGYQAELENVYTLFPRLREKSGHLGWSLSGGEQQMLAVGRGLMARPRLLLLDEPSLGLAPRLVGSVFDVIRRINTQGVTLLLIEQNAYAALQISERGYVLENGRIVLSGMSRDLAGDEKVKKAYLGG
ncbi:MAG: ABC transporter ATP-binding protein [Deltaproteobacteria bacterium RBG_13_53_10]|nr:MAG: ABC transporter ATP-binding protein [Deltaproteobacteria bacterium RBG_13_53_10]